jgi:hypothetical protein
MTAKESVEIINKILEAVARDDDDGGCDIRDGEYPRMWLKPAAEKKGIPALSVLRRVVEESEGLRAALKMVAESQAWDGNNPDDDRWANLYKAIRVALQGECPE